MKQLLIVNSAKNINAGASYPTNLSGLQAGAIAFFELGGSSFLSAAPTKNFGIALGRGTGVLPIVIPEVDLKSLRLTKSLPLAGATFAASFTFPTAVVGEDYTILLIKKGAQFNERNVFSITITAGVTTASTNADVMRKAINAKTSDAFSLVASGSSTTVTITSQNPGEDWEIKFADGLADKSTSSLTHGAYAVGDKQFVAKIAQECIADKGIEYLAEGGKDIYPGYPEAIEDLVPNTSGDQGASTAGYALYSLQFAVKRDSAKTRDEVVNQIVHIAVPITANSYSTIETILTGAVEAPLTKSQADELYTAK